MCARTCTEASPASRVAVMCSRSTPMASFRGDDGAEITAQRSFAHFPAMFVRKHERALVIGLGTGTTLGTIAAYPFERIDVAEISPAIVHAAKTYFEGPNLSSLDDSRVSLLLNDGRNVLLLSQARYDLITIELTSVLVRGRRQPLFTRVLRPVQASLVGGRGVAAMGAAPPHSPSGGGDRAADPSHGLRARRAVRFGGAGHPRRIELAARSDDGTVGRAGALARA